MPPNDINSRMKRGNEKIFDHEFHRGFDFGVRGHVRALDGATCRLMESGVLPPHFKELTYLRINYFGSYAAL